MLSQQKCWITKLAIVIISMFALPASAHQPDCTNAKTTVEINQCAAIERDKAKAQMQTYLNAAIKQSASDPLLQKSIKHTQAAWEKFAKAHCDSIYDIWRDGSIRVVMTIDCQIKLIKQRTHQLWATYLDHMDNSPSALPEPGSNN